ncbi:MAG TPA: hypothetical protein VNB24_08795 [Acidimicrobiales bacterium]|nr:hypothetical protein [Acidimicrobiales bacterium]
MLERLPLRYRTPAVARAVVSPSAIIAAGLGAAVAIVVGAPIVAAAAAGAAAWAARVAMAAPRAQPGERVDAFTLTEPWRGFVLEAQSAQARFGRAVAGARSGPLQERLAEIGRRLDDGVNACWRIARQGQQLQRAMSTIDIDSADRELGAVRRDIREASPERRRRLEDTAAALESQLASYQRLGETWEDARDRLRVLTARMDEALARAVELSVRPDMAATDPLADDVESVVGELEALRSALEETDRVTGTASS